MLRMENRRILSEIPHVYIHAPNATALAKEMAYQMSDAVRTANEKKKDDDAMKAHECDMCNTRHIDGDLCDPTTCEHDYDSPKWADGWMVCIYCGDEQPDDYDGDDY